MKDTVPPPPPSRSLLDAVEQMQPVRTRVPWRTLAAVVAALLAIGAVPMLLRKLRVDLPDLPLTWVILQAAAWTAAFVLPLAAAIVPPRGQVLPDTLRQGRIAAAVALTMIGLALAWTPHSDRSLPSDGAALWPTVGHCLRFTLKLWVGAFAVALFAVRRVVRVGSWRAGAALGAAGGALSGLALHFLCAYASTPHVTIAHAGGVALCVLGGALIAPRVRER
jgi:hypothetical protein